MKSFSQFNEGIGVKFFTMDELKNAYENHDFAIISAERDGESRNKLNTRLLRSSILNKHYVFEPAKGGFVENKGSENETTVDGENSFVVVDDEDRGGLEKFMVAQGKKFDQDAILFSPAGKSSAYFLGTSKREDADPKYGRKMNIGNPHWGQKGQYYTKIKAGYFTFS